jgi:hypothetical protein
MRRGCFALCGPSEAGSNAISYTLPNWGTLSDAIPFRTDSLTVESDSDVVDGV